MDIIISNDKNELGQKAAELGASLIQRAISEKGLANVILATGMSQFEMINSLIEKDIDWKKTIIFHLDEYIGLPITHPASFRKYLKIRFADKVFPGVFHYINGEADVEEECLRLEKLISANPIDVAFVGIGENAHLAFNDPPADFETERAYLKVDLDEDCRKQQLGEGWFSSLDEVPRSAISMTIKQIMKSKHIICSVPDARKAKAVQSVVGGRITPNIPSSILKQHESAYLFLDQYSASLLGNKSGSYKVSVNPEGLAFIK